MQGKFLGYPQQQCYGDDSKWMETKAQQQQSHGFHEDSWSTDVNHNNYYNKNQFPLPPMHMKPGGFGKESDHSFSKHHGHGSNLGGNHNMYHQDTMSNGHGHGHGHGFGNNHGYGNGQKFPFGATNTHSPHHGGGVRPFNHHGGGHNDYVSEHEEYEYEAYKEEHIGSGAAKMDEMRYERHGTYGGDVHYANPYGYNNNNRIKPHGHGSHKVNWTLKGV